MIGQTDPRRGTVRLTMAQALVRFLEQQFVERDGIEHRLIRGVFGIFGHGNVTGLGQALDEMATDLPYYQPRSEQAMVHTAAAFARMSNRLETFACTSSVGPGATNMITGAAGATINRLPVLLLPGDTFASRRPHPVLQQLEDFGSPDISVNDALRPVSRFWDRINRPEQLLTSLPEACRTLADPVRTGAVTIALPQDVQTEAYDYPDTFFEKRTYHVPRSLPTTIDLDRALEPIRQARRPLIIAGGGVIYSEATGVISDLSRQCGIPVAETQAGKGSLPWDHPWSVGPIGAIGGLAANRLAAKADVVLAVGTRLGDFPTASHTAFQRPDLTLIHLNIVPMDAEKLGAIPLVGDARETLSRLLDRLREADYCSDPAYQGEVTELRKEWAVEVDRQRSRPNGDVMSQAQVIDIVNGASDDSDIVVSAAGGLPGDLNKLWRTRDPRGYHVEYGYSCMGYEIAGGLGVKLAVPDREVIVMVGDGSYLMLHTEIVTSLQEHLKLIIVLLDNSGFQCIRNLQESAGAVAFGNELRYRDPATGKLTGSYIPIDFAANAESLGAAAFAAATPDELRRAIQLARRSTRTALIHVRTDPEATVPDYDSWWDVPVAEVSGQDGVQAARATYDDDRGRQRFLY